MALDFCISTEQRKAEVEPPVLSLSENMHVQLFLRTNELRRLPQLERMSDFYDDVSYEGKSLVALLHELQQVIPSFIARPQMQATLRSLEQLCQTALAQGKNVYGFCD